MLKEFAELRRHSDDIRALIAPEAQKKQSLRFLNFFMSHECNLHCTYCRVVDQKVPRMSDDARSELFSKLKPLTNKKTVMSGVGGEPTKEPDFLLKVVSDALGAGFFVNITTNGFRLDKSLLGELGSLRGPQQQYLRQIALSVDAEGPKSNLNKALDILYMIRDQQILPVVNTVIGRRTKMPDFKRHTDEIVKNGFFIVPQIISPRVKGGAFSSAAQDEIPSKEQVRELLPYLLLKKYTTGRISVSLGYLWAVAKLLGSEEGRPHVWHCLPNFRNYRRRGRGYIAIDSDGFIGPCQEFPRELDLLRLESQKLSIAFLDKAFRAVTQECAGCFHNCYINEDELRGPRSAVGEIPTALAMAKVIK